MQVWGLGFASQVNARWVWWPAHNSSAWKMETRCPQSKLETRLVFVGKLWVRVRDPALVNKIESNQGRLLLASSLYKHMHQCVTVLTHTCPTHIQTHQHAYHTDAHTKKEIKAKKKVNLPSQWMINTLIIVIREDKKIMVIFRIYLHVYYIFTFIYYLLYVNYWGFTCMMLVWR